MINNINICGNFIINYCSIATSRVPFQVIYKKLILHAIFQNYIKCKKLSKTLEKRYKEKIIYQKCQISKKD